MLHIELCESSGSVKSALCIINSAGIGMKAWLAACVCVCVYKLSVLAAFLHLIYQVLLSPPDVLSLSLWLRELDHKILVDYSASKNIYVAATKLKILQVAYMMYTAIQIYIECPQLSFRMNVKIRPGDSLAQDSVQVGIDPANLRGTAALLSTCDCNKQVSIIFLTGPNKTVSSSKSSKLDCPCFSSTASTHHNHNSSHLQHTICLCSSVLVAVLLFICWVLNYVIAIWILWLKCLFWLKSMISKSPSFAASPATTRTFSWCVNSVEVPTLQKEQFLRFISLCHFNFWHFWCSLQIEMVAWNWAPHHHNRKVMVVNFCEAKNCHNSQHKHII